VALRIGARAAFSLRHRNRHPVRLCGNPGLRIRRDYHQRYRGAGLDSRRNLKVYLIQPCGRWREPGERNRSVEPADSGRHCCRCREDRAHRGHRAIGRRRLSVRPLHRPQSGAINYQIIRRMRRISCAVELPGQGFGHNSRPRTGPVQRVDARLQLENTQLDWC